ncbi:hypothetical protein OIDMADRAFT_31619 [Oidiodendron maius Zn]|uniref:Uncharacterized protein n=1 Tax=Oidiodendron maius (strain Zn) TaxID=913774 RepID=A0A0C3GNS8_OIDMZ|nr:hypothetical protein OIDMADRAFT_31619 [Oidiodendron maius Zn]
MPSSRLLPPSDDEMRNLGLEAVGDDSLSSAVNLFEPHPYGSYFCTLEATASRTVAAAATRAMMQHQEIVAPQENEAEDIHPPLLDFVLSGLGACSKRYRIDTKPPL